MCLQFATNDLWYKTNKRLKTIPVLLFLFELHHAEETECKQNPWLHLGSRLCITCVVLRRWNQKTKTKCLRTKVYYLYSCLIFTKSHQRRNIFLHQPPMLGSWKQTQHPCEKMFIFTRFAQGPRHSLTILPLVHWRLDDVTATLRGDVIFCVTIKTSGKHACIQQHRRVEICKELNFEK